MKIKGRWKRATAFMLAVLLCFSGTLDPGAVRAKAPGDSEKYMVTVEKCKNGTVTLERSGEKGYLYASGETVLARIQPDPGYERKELTVTDEKESSIIPEWDGDMISFPMPAADVVISAVFSPAEGNNGKKDTVPVEDAASGETDAAAKKDTASTEEDTVSAEKDTAPAEEDISSAEKDVSSTEKDGFSTGKDTASGNTEKTKESDTVPGDLSEEKDAGSGNDEKEQENAAGNLADPKGEETAEESGKDETSLEEEVRQTLENNGDVLESLEDEQSTALQMFSARAGEKTEIQVKALTTYYYADYGLGSGHTRRYEVTFEDPDTGDERTVYAYCLQPKKDAPGDCVCVIEPLSENKVTSKVIYYGTGELSGDDSFWARNQIPYDREGLRWIITHIAASKTSGDPDWDHNANSSARELANQLIEYAKTCKTSFPDPEVSFSQTHVTAYREVVSDTWERQRTPVITFNGDEKNYIRLVLPEGVSCLDADSNRVMIGSGIGEEGILIKGGTSFYFAAALDQAEKVSASSELTAYGNITTTYQTYKLTITYGSGNYQNLGMILATEVPSGERELSLTIDWVTVMGELHIEKYARSEQHTDSDKKLAGATFNLLDHQGKKVIPTGQNHITGDIDDSGLITIRPDGCADIK
ncbi:MAG TPA: hypothetical protein DF613_16490, partial [Lachnospiraceae bacterium]|nr:hypothetical protein [Lachnospiraceae bacterium]